MPGADRRELVLQAATEVFGAEGYDGGTTDQVAQAAGVSQPYVMRMFGTKERLFLEVLERATTALLTAFRTAITDHRAAGAPESALLAALGVAYVDLIETRGVHRSLLHAFVQGSDPVIGAHAREGFLRTWSLLTTEAGLDKQTARDFLARGMLISVLLSIGMPDIADDDRARAMLDVTFEAKLAMVLQAQ